MPGRFYLGSTRPSASVPGGALGDESATKPGAGSAMLALRRPTWHVEMLPLRAWLVAARDDCRPSFARAGPGGKPLAIKSKPAQL